MNRLSTLILIGLAALLVSCGSTLTSSSQPVNANYTYSMVVSPIQFTLNSGDWAPLSASVEVSFENQTPKPVSPQPTTQFYSSDSRVTISPAGVVCAGLWDVRYLTCSQTATLPTGYVTITAHDDTRNVTATSVLSIHPRAATIGLSADPSSVNSAAWPGSAEPWPNVTNSAGVAAPVNCISQNSQVQYIAQPVDVNGNPISSCSLGVTSGCVNNNDYTWSVSNSSVAAISNYGYVVALNPGLTYVYAKLNGTISAPAAFVTCPPSSIVLQSSAFAQGAPLPPFSPADLDTLNKGAVAYFTASLFDVNGAPLLNPLPTAPPGFASTSLATVPLSFITSDPLIGTFGTVLPFTSKLTTNTSGRFTVMASCATANCNTAVPNFTLPINAATMVTGETAGFGFPVYSNVIGVTVQGTTGSTVLVTGTYLTDGVTVAHRLLAYDSESLANTQTVELANSPNSLLVAPNGTTAYVGSSDGLVVVNLTTFTSSLQTYPIVGGLSTDVVTGQVIGVSADSRYVVLSDQTNGYVFLIDTTGTKVATRYTFAPPAGSPAGSPPVTFNAVTFAADDSQFWIGGNYGVYLYTGNTFVPISAVTPADAGLSTGVKALAWTPDGQSYFASGATLAGTVSTPSVVNYSTCFSQKPASLSLGTSTISPINLDVTAIPPTAGSPSVPHAIGLAGTQWLNYSVTSSSEVTQAVPPGQTLTPPSEGNICLSTVAVAAPAAPIVASSLTCPPQQVTFSPTLQQEFVTGVVDTYSPGFVASESSCASPQPFIYGYDVANNAEIALPTLNSTPIAPLSGGVLKDGRYLFVGSFDTTNGAVLHRFNLTADTPDPFAENASVPVTLVPSFVAVVPK